MKSISASIIVLAAAVLIVGGAYVKDANTQAFVILAGCAVGLIGLIGWFVSLGDKRT